MRMGGGGGSPPVVPVLPACGPNLAPGASSGVLASNRTYRNDSSMVAWIFHGISDLPSTRGFGVAYAIAFQGAPSRRNVPTSGGNQAERTNGSKGLPLHCSLATFHMLSSTLNSTVTY